MSGAGPADDEEYDALPVVPLGDKKLRACMVTGLVKTEDQASTQPIARARAHHTEKCTLASRPRARGR